MPWRLTVAVDKRGVEASQAGVTSSTCDHRDRHRCFRQQLLRKQQSARCREVERAGSHFLGKQPPEVAFADTDPSGERGNRGAIQSAFVDQSQRATHQFGSRAMHRCAWCALGSAAQARTETRRRCCARGFVIGHVSGMWRWRWADRPAEDSRRFHRRVEQAVEAHIARQSRTLKDGVCGVWLVSGFRHARSVAAPVARDSPFSAINAGAAQKPLRRNPPSTAMHSPVT